MKDCRWRVGVRRWGAAASVLMLGAAVAIRAAGQEAGEAGQHSTTAGVYTAAQSKRGETAYLSKCVSCHTAADHKGEKFIETWSGPLSELFTYIRDTMPEDAPMSLAPDTIADIMAYMLQQNRMPAGAAELPASVDALKRIRLESPKAGEAESRRAGT